MKKFLPAIILFIIFFLVLLFFSNWTPPKRDILDGSIWKVVNLNNLPLVEGTTLTMRFHNRKVSGSSGCNTFTGRYEVKEESIQIHDIELTTNNCLNPEIMNMERDFIKHLANISKFTFTEQELTTSTESGDTIKFASMIIK